jgi:hypothetical protein
MLRQVSIVRLARYHEVVDAIDDRTSESVLEADREQILRRQGVRGCGVFGGAHSVQRVRPLPVRNLVAQSEGRDQAGNAVQVNPLVRFGFTWCPPSGEVTRDFVVQGERELDGTSPFLLKTWLFQDGPLKRLGAYTARVTEGRP